MSRPAQPLFPTKSRGSHARVRAPLELPEPGETIAGKYTLVRRLGEGGMGVVYEAMHARLKQRLAIKLVRPDIANFDEVVRRFEREARAAAQLRSIHAARIIDVDALPNGIPYMVLEYLEGRDLQEELEQTGAMPVADAVEVALQVADAMAEAHAQRIVHRDLKPSNLFVCRVGEPPRRVVKVLDFGISKVEADDGMHLTDANAYFGTPHYAAPEQLRAAASVDARADVWSLGVILYELLTGRTPFVGNPTQVIVRVTTDPVPWPLELRPDLPPELARALMHALQKEPEARFQSMRELAEALAPFGPKRTLDAAVAEAPRGRGRLGEILVADGLLTAADLDRALAEQRRSGRLLGQVLLDLGLVAQPDLLTALAKQQGIIVTREQSSPIAPPTPAREAPTARPATDGEATGRARGRKQLWVATGVALALAVALGVGLVAALTH